MVGVHRGCRDYVKEAQAMSGSRELQELVVGDLVDPISQSRLFWGTPQVYDWMALAMMNTWQTGGYTAVVTPNGAGKTSTVVANLGLSFMAAFPGAKVVSTAGAFRQIEGQLWPVLRAKLSRYPNWKVIEGEIEAPSQRGLPPSSWTAFSATDPGKAEGYHKREYRDENGEMVEAPLLYIIDEAKSVDRGIFEAMYRCGPQHVLVCSTPGEDDGPFFELIDRKPEGWTVIEVSWSDCPHLMVGEEKKRIERLIREMGEKNPFVQSTVFGKFTRAGGYYLFDDAQAIRHAMSGQVTVTRTERAASIDVSGGGDEQVFGFRQGNYCQHIEAFQERDTYLLCTKLIELFKRFRLRPEEIVMDAGGLGQPIIDTLESRGYSGIRRYQFGGKARDQLRYRDRGTEDHFYLRNLINQKAVSIQEDRVLEQQMRKRRFKRPDRLEMESKDVVRGRGEGSPDRLDMLVMLFSDYVSDSLFKAENESAGLKTYQAEIHDEPEGAYGMNFDA